MSKTVFSTQLQTLRNKNNVTQEQLAGALGVSAQAVSKWENGSYPDGDLLPRIADYFGVSIDYLYGRGGTQESIRQKIVNEMTALHEQNEREKIMETIMENCWATIVGGWQDNKHYYSRNKQITATTIGCTTYDEGFQYMRIGPDWEFYFAMPKPEKGYSVIFPDLDKLAELFALLGNSDVLKVLLELGTLDRNEMVTSDYISQKTGIEAVQVEAVMEKIRQMVCAELIRSCHVREKNGVKAGYSYGWVKEFPLMILLAAAAQLRDSVQICALQSDYRQNVNLFQEGLPWQKK